MTKFKRRVNAAFSDRLQSLEFLSTELEFMFSDPKGFFISNLIPGALNHLKISSVLLLVLSFIVEMVLHSSSASFLQIVLLYPFFVIITLFISTALLLLLSLIEALAKLFASLYFYESSYKDGTIFDSALASFFTEEAFLDAVLNHSMEKFKTSIQHK